MLSLSTQNIRIFYALFYNSSTSICLGKRRNVRRGLEKGQFSSNPLAKQFNLHLGLSSNASAHSYQKALSLYRRLFHSLIPFPPEERAQKENQIRSAFYKNRHLLYGRTINQALDKADETLRQILFEQQNRFILGNEKVEDLS